MNQGLSGLDVRAADEADRLSGVLATRSSVFNGTNLVCGRWEFSAKSPIYTLAFWKKSMGIFPKQLDSVQGAMETFKSPIELIGRYPQSKSMIKINRRFNKLHI